MASTNLVDVTAACALRGRLSTIGVVVDKLDAVKTRGSSWCITFTIKDNDFDGPSWQGGLKVKFFNDDPNLLPAVQKNDVVLLRNIRINSFQDRPTGVATQNDTVHWAIFRSQSGSGGNLSIIQGPVPFQSTSNEKRVATELLAKIHDDESFANTQSSPQPVQPVPVPQQSFRNVQSSASTPKPSHLPYSLIQDVKAGRLTQLLGQVVKMNTYDSNKTLIYLTDYTVNEYLVDIRKDDDDAGVEGDAYGYLSRKKQNWPGPWGQLSIQVALWEPHASFAREYVKEGSLVHLTYVHVKDDRSGGIEAAVHRDKRFGDKIHVRIISEEYDERARDLMERRKAYWKIHGKPSADPKKAERKAEKQKNNKQEPKEARREEGQTVLPKPTAQKKINRYIKCRDHGIPPLHDLDSILSAKTHINNIGGDITYKLPFQNICYRPLVRVVDFYPPNLKDFAVKVNVNPIVGYGEGEDDLGPRYTTWDWRFCLLVEGTEPIDPKQQPRELMKIFVTGGEGTHLLGLDPDNLRTNKGRLHELREKLFILWGDLEERKREAAATATGDDESWTPVKTSAVPFVCCIKEYGVECGHNDPDAMSIDGRDQDMCSQPGCFGWERRFALFGTTIHS